MTAEKLVKQYKTLEAVYEHLDELPTKTADKFVEYRDDAIMSKRLVDLMHVP